MEAIPTLPLLLMTKFVAVEDPTTNWLLATPAVGLMTNDPQGVDEATPTFPFVAMKRVDVPMRPPVPLKYPT